MKNYIKVNIGDFYVNFLNRPKQIKKEVFWLPALICIGLEQRNHFKLQTIRPY